LVNADFVGWAERRSGSYKEDIAALCPPYDVSSRGIIFYLLIFCYKHGIKDIEEIRTTGQFLRYFLLKRTQNGLQSRFTVKRPCLKQTQIVSAA
jgi:hypothetical protein